MLSEPDAREILMMYARSAANGEHVPNATHRAEQTNTSCGDRVELTFHIAGETIERCGFSAQGCALCSASAALLSDMVVGLSLREARMCAAQLAEALQSPPGSTWPKTLEAIQVFEALRENRFRQQCVMLPWHALSDALRSPTDAAGRA